MIKYLFITVVLLTMISCGGSDSSSSGESNDDWSIDTQYVQGGGPGKDGIPSLERPSFVSIDEASYMFADDLVVVIKVDDQIKVYPHKVLDWHEVVNDNLAGEDYVLSYCPLTGSAMAWDIDNKTGTTDFGVSGILYNSNLILYDRATDSNWPQMLMISAKGSKKGSGVNQRAVFETRWEVLTAMYPEALVVDNNTGFSRNYQDYPYGSFRTSNSLLFNVNNQGDARLHPKQRVLGVKVGTSAKAYNISAFAGDIEIINDTINSKEMVIIGSQNDRLSAAFERQVSDGTVLEFTAEFNQLPIVMSDNEGNMWDINGVAISGDREGENLSLPFTYAAYWYAWAAFFPDTTVYE